MFSSDRNLLNGRERGARCEYCRGRPPDYRCRNCSGVRGSVRRAGAWLTSPAGVATVALVAFAGGGWAASEAPLPGTELHDVRSDLAQRTGELRSVEGRLAVREIQAERLRRIQSFSARYDVPADLAASVYDVSLAEGLRPELAFRLVETESSFRRSAVSEAGAIGYTQIKPSTAAWLEPGVTYEKLFETETNLRLGFRYLRLLMQQYGDARLALLAYNRGPTRVGDLLAMGRDPANGYARRILAGLE